MSQTVSPPRIATDLIPLYNETQNIGAPSVKWAAIYADALYGNISGTAIYAAQATLDLIIAKTLYLLASSTTAGNFTLNGATPVSITNSSAAVGAIVLFGLRTPGGTVGNLPTVKTINAGVGFTVAGTAGDTSDYSYHIILIS